MIYIYKQLMNIQEFIFKIFKMLSMHSPDDLLMRFQNIRNFKHVRTISSNKTHILDILSVYDCKIYN